MASPIYLNSKILICQVLKCYFWFTGLCPDWLNTCHYFQVEYVKEVLPGKNGGLLVTCLSATSGIGRLVFGKVADLPNVNGIFLQQISFVVIGLCTILLTVAPKFTGFEWESMVICALIMGLFDGCFITMLGLVAFDLCGPSGASQGKVIIQKLRREVSHVEKYTIDYEYLAYF